MFRYNSQTTKSYEKWKSTMETRLTLVCAMIVIGGTCVLAIPEPDLQQATLTYGAFMVLFGLVPIYYHLVAKPKNERQYKGVFR